METFKGSTWAKPEGRDLEGKVEWVESPLGKIRSLFYAEGPMGLFPLLLPANSDP